MSRRINRVKQETFAEAYIEAQGIAKIAARNSNTPYDTARRWLSDPIFKKYLDQLKVERREMLEAIAFKRASEKSDTLLIFLLKSLAPEQYDDAIRLRKYAQEHGATPEEQRPIIEIIDRPPRETFAEWCIRHKHNEPVEAASGSTN